MEPYHQWFNSDLDKLIELRKKSIGCWVFGHTHTPTRHIIYDTNFICNPIGYNNNLTSSLFDTEFVL
jgi:hypothetical protein